MPQFDVYRDNGSGSPLFLNCQSDLLDGLSTRLVVPLMAGDVGPSPALRLNPIFEVQGRLLTMYTQFASAVPVRELGPVVESLVREEYAIGRALDVLLGGV